MVLPVRLRGQGDLIAAVIIVGTAVALALALVGYIVPGVARYNAEQQRAAALSQAIASITGNIIAYKQLSSGTTAVAVYISNHGTQEYRVYLAVMARQGETVFYACNSSTAYNLTGEYGGLELNTGSWQLLPYFYAEASRISLVVGNDYVVLGHLGTVQSKTFKMFDLGLLPPQTYRLVKVEIQSCPVNTTPYIYILVSIDNSFYEVGELPVPTT